MRLCAMMLLLAGPVVAQDTFDISFTAACMEDAITSEERSFCVGASTRQCIEHLGDPAVVLACAQAETAWWSERMATVFKQISRSAEVDADQAKALAQMQAAWLAYRNTSCAFERAFGAEQGLVETECLLWMTGDQAVYLEDYMPGY